MGDNAREEAVQKALDAVQSGKVAQSLPLWEAAAQGLEQAKAVLQKNF